MPISERQKDILWAIIEEHAKVADPVSSKALSERRGFDIGAPMIRKEMNQLEKEGYLVQPHTSAGRVPSDKAYRLYIQEQLGSQSKNKAVAVGLTPRESQKIKQSLKKEWGDEQSLLKEISRLTSDISKELSISGTVGGENTYTFGFSNLVDEPEFSSFNNINQLMHFMDNVDRCFDDLWNKFLYEDLQVFIGDENPIKEINEFTLITGKYQLPQGKPHSASRETRASRGRHGFVSIIGPKRMNYKRNMALVEYISSIINDK